MLDDKHKQSAILNSRKRQKATLFIIRVLLNLVFLVGKILPNSFKKFLKRILKKTMYKSLLIDKAIRLILNNIN